MWEIPSTSQLLSIQAVMATETQTIPQGQSTPPQKFSRYRSVRQANANSQIPRPSPGQETSSSQNESIQRSMSRYRKRSCKPDPVSSPPLPQQPSRITKPPQSHAASLAALTGEPYPQEPDSPKSPPFTTPPSRPRQHTVPKEVTSAKVQSSCNRLRQEARERAFTESDSLARVKAQEAAEREVKLEKRRAVAAEEKRFRERVEAERQVGQRAKWECRESDGGDGGQKEEHRQLATNKPTTVRKESVDLQRGNSVRQRLASFTKPKSAGLLDSEKIQRIPEKKNLSASRRTRGTGSPPGPSPDVTASKSTPSNNITSATWVDAPISKPSEQPVGIRPAQWVDAPVTRPAAPSDAPIPWPQYDAPVSAVNAGERYVLVKFNDSSITLPVTPTTTPRDLLHAASTAMPELFDPNRSKLKESFAQLGLERPLRDYEHVRDVMNSWENDEQNVLVILPSTEVDQNNKLEAKNAPKKQPGDISVYMYHSQRPGSWDKRWITLRSDGQVMVAKRPGQEASNICHLTDFDVYAPTHRQQTKKIRPPKKICFAVKSQQKSNVFLEGLNFVHFFASNDSAVAGQWHDALQSWRSWYLVNVLEEGQKSKRASINDHSTRPSRPGSLRRASIDATPNQFASSRPLIDFNQDSPSNAVPTPRATKSAEVFQSRKLSTRDKAPPPSAFPNKLSKDAETGAPTTNRSRSSSEVVKGPTPDEVESSTFAPGGLLGRTYTLRQQAQREREANVGRSHTMKTTNAPTGLTRKASTKSVKQMPKPLIDLTPQFQEPPQHAKKGKGVTAEPGQLLVDAATGPDLAPGAIVTPSSKAWRRPQAHSPPQDISTRPRGQSVDTARPSRQSLEGGRAQPLIGVVQPQVDDRDVFAQGGLVAGTLSKRAQGGSGTGHGVKTGDRNAIGKPMIDLQMKSQFADGTLLRQVEVQTGGDGPVIDREKRIEESVRVGEGV